MTARLYWVTVMLSTTLDDVLYGALWQFALFSQIRHAGGRAGVPVSIEDTFLDFVRDQTVISHAGFEVLRHPAKTSFF
jgi:hypothetical protein